MSEHQFIRTFLLPHLRWDGPHRNHGSRLVVRCRSLAAPQPCPRCGVFSVTGYDAREVRVRDEPFRTRPVELIVKKRRLLCKPCGKVFTETIPGIRKRARYTERFCRAVLSACEKYSNLSDVQRDLKCSSGFVHSTLYRHLELQQRMRARPWPEAIGIDEHCFGKRRPLCPRRFVTMVVDHKAESLFEVVGGKTTKELEDALENVPGRENVKVVTLDMCDPFRNFSHAFFPNAVCVADKFHVLRLLDPAITKRRVQLAGNRRDMKTRRLLLASAQRLSIWDKLDLRQYLDKHPELRELHEAREALFTLYRTKGADRANTALEKLQERFRHSAIPELRTLAKTLRAWHREIIAHFVTGLTNARVEGFNNKAKLVKRRAYGYRSERNYRLRLLNTCRP